MKIVNLLTNNLSNPMGYEYESLLLSWQVTKAESSYSSRIQLCISKTQDMKQPVFDSGILENYRECQYSIKLSLEPRTRYYWQVWVKGNKGEEALSEVNYFETAKGKENWIADWIGVSDSEHRMPYIYKEFQVFKHLKSARVYLYGLGLYEAYLNNKHIGQEYLLPGYHSYDRLMEYQTFDITEYLLQGNNEFGILLGEGWYKGRFGFDGYYKNLYGNQKKCIVEIHLTYMDGSETRITTDKDWKARESNVLENGIYDGECINETLDGNVLQLEVIQDSKELLTERTNPPIKKTEQYAPVKITRYPDGSFLCDFGKIITGWVEINADFKANQKMSFYYGEVLQNDEFYNDNLRTAKAEFHYTSCGGKKTIRPHFTYYGFQYVKIEGLTENQLEDIHAYQIMSDLKLTGSIITSNTKVNQLFQNTIQSQRCNFLDIPTDCPQRDERMGWTGDVTIFAKAACFHMQSSEFFHHYLKSLKKEQELLNGSVPFFVPTPKIEPHEGINPFYITSGVTVWGDVATILPWTLYEYYGNKDRLKEHYPVMTSWVDYVTKRTKENPVPYLWQNDRQLGDWLALDQDHPNNPVGKTDSGLIASAYYYYSVTLCAKAAKVLGDEREESYFALANQIKEAFLKEYFDENASLKVEETQTAYAILLFYELYPLKGKAKIIERLEELIRENNNHLNTGFVGTPILCPALSENGLNQTAYTLLLNEDYPSWLYEVNLGATTIWERWNSVLEDGSMSGTDMNSLNHYAYGSIADWMYRYLCGFRPDMGNDIKMVIKPMPDERMKEVKGFWESPYGIYRCEWSFDELLDIHYKIEIPFNANAKIVFTNGKELLLEANVYYFDKNGDIEILNI